MHFSTTIGFPLGGPMRPEMTQGRTSQAPPSFPCRLCGGLTPLYVVERLGGFCSEEHKQEWLVIILFTHSGGVDD